MFILIPVGILSLLCVVAFVSVRAANAPDIGLPLLLAAVAGIVLATVGWFILPEASEAAESGVEPMVVPAEANERYCRSSEDPREPRPRSILTASCRL
jgi:hypothetical protein